MNEDDSNNVLRTSAADQQPPVHTAGIAERALLKDPLFTYVHIVVASSHNMQTPNKEFTQRQTQTADRLSPTHNATVSTSGFATELRALTSLETPIVMNEFHTPT